MQIDFHHTVTYVAARFAGYDDATARIIACAAQYVDDATSSGPVVFGNRALYTRIHSAHRTLDPENLNDVENHLVWLPFHFLPGNGGEPAGRDPAGTFIRKLICVPATESPIAADMVAELFRWIGKPNALHRLGITLHVFADTWAHQGFAGVLHPVNDVEDEQELDSPPVFAGGWLKDAVADLIPPFGHGRADVWPDMPFLRWQYRNGLGETVSRDNTALFCTAADEMCKLMKRFQAGDPHAEVTGMPRGGLDKIRRLFIDLRDRDGDHRHSVWLRKLAQGYFNTEPTAIEYHAEGAQSWKADALGTSANLPVYDYTPAFLSSHWKRFHDALQQHRLFLLKEILPSYGICAG